MTSPIRFFPSARKENATFSILIPSWNNLPYLETCVESIRKNSRYTHEIIVHVNEGKDGTLEWVKSQGLSHTHSLENTGVCYGFNAPASLGTTPYLVLSDDDYYYAPDWDYHLMEEVKVFNGNYFCITGTIIEHTQSQYDSILSPFDFGKTVETFQEERFLREYDKIPFADWNGGNWYPLLMHKQVWDMIGGLSIEYTPGMASDPDMMIKLWHCGVRYYKGVSRSRAYHFGSRTTARVRRNDGNKQFLLKWGLSKSTFFDYYLKLGKPFTGPTPEPDLAQFRAKLLRDKLKRAFSSWR